MARVKQTSFVKNAVILSAAGIVARMISSISRIVLYRLIGDEGIGLYTMGYQVYAMLFAISVSGIAVAISKLVAEETSRKRYGEAQRVFRTATVLLASIGFVSSVVLILAARFIAVVWIGEPRAIYSYIAVAPAIFVVTLMAALRGRFQGEQKMVPTAISQIVEQIGKVAAVLILAAVFVNKGAPIEHTAAAASFGTVIGALFGLIVVVVIYLFQKRSISEQRKRYPLTSNRTTGQIIKRILAFSIPITLGAMVIPLINFVDMALVPRRLQVAGFAQNEATALYGNLTGAAVPLINIPSMLAYALAASLVPAISAANAMGRKKIVSSRSTFAVKLILLIGIPAAVGLSLLATPIAEMLYANPEAGVPLKILAYAAIVLTLHQTCSGILQGLGHTTIPVKNLFIGGLIKIVLNYTLVAIPSLNIRGAAIATVTAYTIAGLLNLRAVIKYTGMKVRPSDMILKPIIAAGLMGLTALNVHSYVLTSIESGGFFAKIALMSANTVATLFAVAMGGLVYAVALFIVRTFSRNELNLIPVVGPVVVPIAEKLRLLRRDKHE